MNSLIISKVQSPQTKASPAYRYDIFKGSMGEDGKIVKVRSVGSAYHREGQTTLTIALKTFLKDPFYLLPATKPGSTANYVIFTRELARNIKRKYFWNCVGEGQLLEGGNHGLMKLSWDLLSDDLYMSLHPINIPDADSAISADEAVA